MSRHGMERRHLELADRHIAEGRERIEHQGAILLRLQEDGQAIVEASKLPAAFKATLVHFESHRQLILEALAEPETS